MKMKKILLLIVLPFTFLSVLSAQITQEQADEIVLERISQRMIPPYTIYAKKNLQDGIGIVTSANETLDLDYWCWIYFYYSNANNAVGHYLIVNGNNGNVLEINAKSDGAPRDLDTWRVVNAGFELGQLEKILDGYAAYTFDFDSKGNAWIATQKGLVCYNYNTNETTVYNSENSAFSGSVYDIAVDKNDNVWIASLGVWKFDGTEFTFYDSKNTPMPEDIVWSIAVDSQNNIWMASCRFQMGGLVKYDGTAWTVYTPDNSPLPGNFIHDITIDKLDNVWLALSDSTNRVYLAKISNDQWTAYNENDFGFMPRAYIHRIQFDSKNRLWGTFNFGYLSTIFLPPPHLFIFDGNNTTQLSVGNIIRSFRYAQMFIDRNDYVWCFNLFSVSGVWINERWIQFDRSEFDGNDMQMIKEDPNGKIWFGTENGIYIRGNTE